LAAARIAPADIDYVEAFGTGTSLGDPIEAQALANVLGEGRASDNPLVVGSVKTNLGHLESAAGMAGILKVVLAMQHESIPPHLHFRKINPNIDWTGVPIEIPITARAWPRGGRRRIAGISSFGFSGTNAHVILEEAPIAERRAPQVERPLHLITLSARTAEALRSLEERVLADMERNSASFPDIAYTANAGRSHFQQRLAVVSPDAGSLRQALAAGDVIRGVERPTRGKLAFLFTGQGSQWPGMCRELYDTSPVFRSALDECAGRLRLERPLLDVIYGPDGALLEQTGYSQPAIFAIEWSLARLWSSWGIEPDVVLGHSVGEYAALTVAGVWTLEEGLRLITERSRLMQALGPGWGMISVQAGARETEQALRGLEGFVSVAGRNAPASTVVSGRLLELSEVERRLAALGLKAVRLQVSHGFHSPQMEGAAQEFARFAQSIEPRQSRCGIVSSVTGRAIGAAELRDREYWRRQVLNAVEFQTGMETLAASGCDGFLEVGPAATLCGLGRQSIGAAGHLWAPSIRRERGAWRQMLESLAHLYVRGAAVNWSAFDAPYERRRAPLPTYPFQRQRYWIEPPKQPKPKSSGHSLPGQRTVVAGAPETYVWETELSTATLPYLADHRIQGAVAAPATLYMEMAVSAARELLGGLPVELNACEFPSALTFPDGNAKTLQLVATGFDGTGFAFRIFSRTAGTKEAWIQNASGRASRAPASASSSFPGSCPERDPDLLGAGLYESLETRGIQFGTSFRNLERAWRVDDGAYAEVLAPEALRKAAPYTLHPALVDSCMRSLLCIPAELPSPMVMTEVGAFRVYGAPEGTRLRVLARIDSALMGSVRIFDENGALLAEAEAIQGRALAADLSLRRETDDWLFRVGWVKQSLPEEGPPARSSGFWLIFADRGPDANEAALKMRSLGAACGIVRAGVQYRQVGTAEFVVRGGSSGDLDAVLDAMRQQTSKECCGIFHLWSLDTPAESDPPPLSQNRQDACGSVPALVQALLGRPVLTQLRIFLITAGAVAVDGEVQVSTVQAPMWGLGRILAHEHPELWGGW
jgi:myxalamid-type polyketide synthase MxaB